MILDWDKAVNFYYNCTKREVPMEDSRMRPRAVALVGGIYMLVGFFMLLSGGAAIASMLLVDTAAQSGMAESLSGAPAMLKVTVVFVRYFGAVAVFQVIAAVAVIVSAVQFLKLRAWARAALEVFTWLSLVAAIFIGGLWAYSWAKMTAAMPPEMTAPLSPGAFSLIGAALWAGLALVIVAVSAVMIRFLRDEAVRKALS
jgi:hypothetical protein